MALTNSPAKKPWLAVRMVLASNLPKHTKKYAVWPCTSNGHDKCGGSIRAVDQTVICWCWCHDADMLRFVIRTLV